MLIRNAEIDGVLTDVRLMHGAVQAMGHGLPKGLYESELEMNGDELRPYAPNIPLPARLARRMRSLPVHDHIIPGTPAPLTRWRDGAFIGWIDEHSAD
ncbi:MAG: hypothetical protein IJ438_13095 [Clostridia bacterium]|nr:hypothetical protein [Clostridia bacterium]